MKEKLAVIILNYNSYEDTLKLIRSMEEYDPGFRIIVVDNASDPEERMRLEGLREKCGLILLEENGGYAAGNNAGIRRAIELECDAFLLANSDTYLVSSHAISDCYDYMKKNRIGILGPRMVNASGKDISGYICVDQYGRTKHRLTDDITECMSLVGAFLLIDRKVIERIGYMKEFYFLYREETDFCLRAYNNGEKIVYYPSVTIVHRSGTTTKKIADYYYHRNMFILSREVYGTGSIQLAVFYFFRFIFYSLCLIRRTASWKEMAGKMKMIWLAYIDGVRDIRGKRQLLAETDG